MPSAVIKFTSGLIIGLILSSCDSNKMETIGVIKNGEYEVDVRSQELYQSGIKNVDICVNDISSHGFPKKKIQCFLEGYDFVGLNVKWHAPHEIEISFNCGRVSLFRNYATIMPPQRLNPVEFHAVLLDKSDCPSSKDGHP